MRTTFKLLTIILLGFNGFFLEPVFSLPNKAEKIESFIQKELPNTPIGIQLLEAETGKVLYEKNAHMTFTPASNTKLFTAVAALLSLGADYRFETAIKTDKSNHLYIQFRGDPSLTTGDLKQMISEFKASGIHQIQDIIIDDTRFQTPDYPLGWTWDAMLWYYGAPVTAIILNENQIPLTINSNKQLGGKAEVTLAIAPETTPIKLYSDLITVSEEESETRCQFQMEMNQENNIYLKGCWFSNDKPNTVKVALKNPYKFMEQSLLGALQSENIEFKGKIKVGVTPIPLKMIVSHYSEPLSELLKKVLQDSNNLYAESITKTLGAERFQQGTFQAGVLAIKEILSKSTRIDVTKLKLMDGSGLSRYNLVTPNQLTRLLYTMYHDKKLAEIFKEALPVGGAPGTLCNRMGSEDIKGKVRAKTGTLAGVSTLSGYLTTAQGKDLIFAIMINNTIQDTKSLEDELCRLFMNVE